MKIITLLFAFLSIAATAQIDSTKSIMLQGEPIFSVEQHRDITLLEYRSSKSLQSAGTFYLVGLVAPAITSLAHFALNQESPVLLGIGGGIGLVCFVGGSISLISAGKSAKEANRIKRRALQDAYTSGRMR